MLRPRGGKERKERQAALAARFDAEPLVAGGSVVVYRGAFGLADWGIQRQQLPIKVTTTIIEGGDHRMVAINWTLRGARIVASAR
jgi:hypothetical protein